MAEYSQLNLRRFASAVLPFLCILVTGELRGDNDNAFTYFENALGSSDELRGIAEDQKIDRRRYCMYLVNFHDYIEAALHVNMQSVGRDVGTLTYTPDFIKARKILTHLELAPRGDLDELYEELFTGSLEDDETKLNLLIRCLHIFFTHLLVLNIELQRAHTRIVKNATNSSREKLLANAKLCIAPELPTYLIDALHVAAKYCTCDISGKAEPNVGEIFTRETNIGYNDLLSIAEYQTILPLINAYKATLQPIPLGSRDALVVCDSVLASEMWRVERSVN